MYPLFMVPGGEPGRMTLQASDETWRALETHLRRAGDIRLAQQVAAGIVEGQAAPAIRLTVDQENGQRLLRLAGVAG